jgi:hypothetical protein
MILVMIGVISGFGITHICTSDLGFAFFMAIFGGICGGIFALFATIAWSSSTKVYKTKSKYKIASLKNVSGGNFYLGSGSLNGNYYYFFHKEIAFNRYVPERIITNDDVEIIEEARDDGELIILEEYKDDVALMFSFCFPINEKFEFHIPKGSIAHNYQL